MQYIDIFFLRNQVFILKSTYDFILRFISEIEPFMLLCDFLHAFFEWKMSGIAIYNEVACYIVLDLYGWLRLIFKKILNIETKLNRPN